jgi:[acyl-carrier-protein] S-malonyltransferase
MAAITGLPAAEIEAAIAALDVQGVIGVAAVNAPLQVTASGDPAPIDALVGALAGTGARVTPLRVSGAWHSEHMRPAVERFERALAACDLGPPTAPLVFNRHGREAAEPAAVRELLAGQLVTPIRWDAVMARLDDSGITDYVEIGPGRVLRGLVRLNLPDRDVAVHNVADRRSLERALAALVD